jgi:DNA-binding response OmpR family regulator/predicted regulator of Ras-like GTPase activity (Roadblock/LC7/MglB family)
LNWLVRNRLFQVVVTMSDVWRIFVVEAEEALNHNIVNSLRKDGYIVQGVMNGADAIHILWSEEYDVVLCDLKAPGADGFELLQWLRASHPNTRTILIGAPDSADLRMQALESGAAGYLEKPLDLHLLKEELRRLLQQTGFSANLDSFDLLDVIQIITMSRKSIALLANTGLEERGLLCFKNGDLVWAEYGILRGEEAFFALAAHKNGTVTQQPWNEQVVANVTQPLSRLIFQALQYRTKYANQQPYSGELVPVSGGLSFDEDSMASNTLLMAEDDDDTPFGVLGDSLPSDVPFAPPVVAQEANISQMDATREWWQRSGAMSSLNSEDGLGVAGVSLSSALEAAPTMAIDGPVLADSATPAYKALGDQRNDLPSWLTEQPTAAHSAIPSPMLSASAQIPVIRASSPEWQPSQPINGALISGMSTGMRAIAGTPKQTTGTHQRKQATGTQKQISQSQNRLITDTGARRASPAEWQMPEPSALTFAPIEDAAQNAVLIGTNGSADFSSTKEASGALQSIKHDYNYSALVSALQSLGYSIPGFIAAAVVNIEGQSIAQVAVDELDISRVCKHFSTILKGTQQSLAQGMWGDFENTVITSSDRYILMRVIGNEHSIFQILITTHEAKPVESLEVMTNVEGAISAALRI